MSKLTKVDLKLEIARVVAISHKEAKDPLEIILDSMVRALRKGERIEIQGLEASAHGSGLRGWVEIP